MFGAIIADGCAVKKYRPECKLAIRNTTDKDEFEISFMTIRMLAVCDVLQKGIAYDEKKVVEVLNNWMKTYDSCSAAQTLFGRAVEKSMENVDENSVKVKESFPGPMTFAVSPCGWYGRDEREVKALTHSIMHAVGADETKHVVAEAVATCVYYARIGKSKRFIKEYFERFLNVNLEYEKLRDAYADDEYNPIHIAGRAMRDFLESESFDRCVMRSLEDAGIVGAVAEAFYKDTSADRCRRVMKSMPEAKNGCDAREVLTNFIYDVFPALTEDEEITDNTKFVCVETQHGDKTEIEWAHSTSCRYLMDYVIATAMQDDEEYGDKIHLLKTADRGYFRKFVEKVRENSPLPNDRDLDLTTDSITFTYSCDYTPERTVLTFIILANEILHDKNASLTYYSNVDYATQRICQKPSNDLYEILFKQGIKVEMK